MIYGDITDYKWFNEDITAREIANDLKTLGEISNLTVRINSYGGSVFAAIAIYNTLKRHTAYKTVRVEGLAASAASLIAMAGDEIVMAEGSMMMIHNIMEFMYGLYNANELREKAELLDQMTDASILTIYGARTGLDDIEVQKLMDAETWLSAVEAVELGFADRAEEAAPQSMIMVSGLYAKVPYRNIPEDIKSRLGGKKEMPEKTSTSPIETRNSDDNVAKAELNAITAPVENLAPSLKARTKDEPTETVPLEQTNAYQAGLQAGIKQERERLSALDAIKATDCAELLHEAKYISPKSPGEVALAILSRREQKGLTAYNANVTDAVRSGAYDVVGGSAPQNEQNTAREIAVNKEAACLAQAVNEKRGFMRYEQ